MHSSALIHNPATSMNILTSKLGGQGYSGMENDNFAR